MTNSPICASQATPSANERVATRCGSSLLPRTSAATYTAAKPEACTRGRAAVRQERQAEDGERVETGGRQRDPAHHPGAAEADAQADHDADRPARRR